MLTNRFYKKTDREMLIGSVATAILIALYIWFAFVLDKKSQKDDEILQQKLVSIQKELENKDLDIYTKVKLHETENTLIYFDSKSPEYRKLKRQILKEYRYNKRLEKTR